MTSFHSPIKNLKIVVKSGTPVYEGGVKIGDRPGKYAQFVNGVFETNDKEIINHLMKMPTFGFDFFKGDKKETENQSNVSNENLQTKTKTELLAMANDKGIAVNKDASKEEIINLLKA